ncbi:MAG TPA: APC family permease [Thermoanaerobaculia bacterium]|nr:APC family permease [Thermoanaerobaculia bacterium]
MTELRREIGLWRGVALNMIDMVGIGPFITIPLILSAMGGRRAMLAWLLGALLAISDGLVTAELAAELPASGGTYVFLREAYGRDRWGRLLSFLFLFQILISAPLSMASGAIGFAKYLVFLFPAISWPTSAIAAVACALLTLVLLRRIGTLGKLSILLWAGVLATVGIIIAAGLPRLQLSAFAFWRAPRLDGAAGYAGLLTALVFAVYDYLGYYNICYLGDEIRDPTRTIPRVIVISILAIAVLYVLMNACLVSVLPMRTAMTSEHVFSDYLAALLGPRAARAVTLLILWTGLASVFSLILGYSRILWAAGRDRNFFAVFGRLHPSGAFPWVAILWLGATGTIFCLLPLPTVIRSIVTIRAIIPFFTQVLAAVILRIREPGRPRPFRMWLYPLPAAVAMVLWGYIVVSPEKGFKPAGAAVMAAGLLFFLARAFARRQWPFVRRAAA